MMKRVIRKAVIIGVAVCCAGVGIAEEPTPYIKGLIEKTKQGDAEAQVNLATCYFNGIGVAVDEEKGLQLLEEVAEQQHKEELLAQWYKSGKKYKEAVKWYTKAAEQGHANAQCNLGVMYNNGEGVPQDYKKAVKWYMKAAEQGHANAQNNLASCYYIGNGVRKNYVEAYGWSLLAALNGKPQIKKKLEARITYDQIEKGQIRAKELQNIMKKSLQSD